MANACATCASSFNSAVDPISEKPLLPGRHLECCGRSICSRCLNQNKRYETYCPYCQITTEPSLLPQGLKDPPAYTSLESRSPPPTRAPQSEALPAYSEHRPSQVPSEKSRQQRDGLDEDVLHFVRPNDSMHSVALAYNIPVNALRKTNNIYSDYLIRARKTILIPGEFYKGGVSLSAQPLEGEEEEAKRNKVRRWMMACKVAEYDVAVLYLKQSEWTLDDAIEAYKEDERWEKEHPLEANDKSKKGKTAKDTGMRRFVGSSRGVSSPVR